MSARILRAEAVDDFARGIRREVVQAAVLAARATKGDAYEEAYRRIAQAVVDRLGLRPGSAPASRRGKLVAGTLRTRITSASGMIMSWIELPDDAGNVCLHQLGDADSPIEIVVFRSDKEK